MSRPRSGGNKNVLKVSLGKWNFMHLHGTADRREGEQATNVSWLWSFRLSLEKMSHKVSATVVWSSTNPSKPRHAKLVIIRGRGFFSHLIPLIRLKIPYTFYFHARYTAIFFSTVFLSRAKKAENSRCIKLFECCIKYAEVIKPRPLCSVFYWLTAKRGRIWLGRP